MTTHITRMACGWEMGTLIATNGSTGEWGNSSPNITVVTQAAIAARSGGYGLRINPSAQAAKQSREFNLSQAFVLRFYFKFPTLPAADSDIFYIGEGAGATTKGVQLRFISSDSKVKLVELDSTGAVIETSTGPVIVADTWYRIDILYRSNSTCDWQIATGDGPGSAQTQIALAATERSIGGIFFGTNSVQTFDLYIDDLYGAYSTDDAGENGAALAAEYPRGPGYCKSLVATGTSSPDSSDFSTTDGSALGSSHQILDDIPMLGAPGVRQDTADATAYMEYGLTDLAANEVPHALSVVAEGRAPGGGSSPAELKIVKDGTAQSVINAGWNNDVMLHSVTYLPGDSQTTKWTASQVNSAAVRWGYDPGHTNPPVIGGFVVTADVSVAEELEAYWGVGLQ